MMKCLKLNRFLFYNVFFVKKERVELAMLFRNCKPFEYDLNWINAVISNIHDATNPFEFHPIRNRHLLPLAFHLVHSLWCS
jgi:hypothetical protein